jgi:hypothetical protein
VSVKEHCSDKFKLNNPLKSFNANVRKNDGSLYSKNSLTSFRFGVARYHLSEKKIDIMSDNDFCSSNETYFAVTTEL